MTLPFAMAPILASRQIINAVNHTFLLLTIISGVLMALIIALMLIFAIKYHHKRHPKPASIHGNTKLEIFWTVVPTLIAIWMFFIGYSGFKLMRNPPKGAYEVNVTARQWSFSFQHPQQGGVTDSVLVVPINTPVKCNLTAKIDDVVHSFYLPYFKVKEDCVPGYHTFLWFEADEITSAVKGDVLEALPGKRPYHIFCAEFCGKDHSRMRSQLHVVSKEDFGKYLDHKLELLYKPIRKDDISELLDPNSEQIKACNAPEMFATYCASCHGPHGEGGLVEGARSFKNDPASKWKRSPKLTDIFRTLTLGIDGTRMKPFDNLPAWDRFALAHHVASLYKDGPARAKPTKEEVVKLIDEFKLDEQKKVVRRFPIDEAIKELSSGE